MIYTVTTETHNGYDSTFKDIAMVTTDKDKSIQFARDKMGKGEQYESIFVESWYNEFYPIDVFAIFTSTAWNEPTIREVYY